MSCAAQHQPDPLPSPTYSVSSSLPNVGKRKRAMEPKFYAVRFGSTPGIYDSYAECMQQVKGFKNASFKAFATIEDAKDFLDHGLSSGAVQTANGSQKFYAVRSGRVPGIYTDWPTAEQQIVGWSKPKFKSFPTRAEAESFLQEEPSALTDAQSLHASAIVGEPKKKRQRKSAGRIDMVDGEVDEVLEPGSGPLPSIVEDGFDPKIILNPKTGTVVYKSAMQMTATKMQAIGPSEEAILRIHTDGSSLSNGQEGASAGVGVYFGPQDPRNISDALSGPRQTNQRAELTAIQRAIDIAPLDRDVLIYSDSNYAIKCVTEWFQAWRKNGWLTANKKAVENRDLVEAIISRIEEREKEQSKTKFHWVKGHANDAGNVAADALAVAGARKSRKNGSSELA